MPKHRKGKGKATGPMAVPSLDNRPRFSTPEVQVPVPQLPTREPTPVVKTRDRQVAVERKAAKAPVPDRLVRVPEAILRKALVRADLRKPVASVHEEEEEEEVSACGEISDEDHDFDGPWVAKGNPTGFLDSDDEAILDKCGLEWKERREEAMKRWEWKFVTKIVLKCTVNLVDSELVETEDSMKEFDLMIRILGEDGSTDDEGLMRITYAFMRVERELDEYRRQHDDADTSREARDGIIAGLKEQIAQLSVRKESSELVKQLADWTHDLTTLAENAGRVKEKLTIAERKAEEAEEKAEEKWREWAEKEAQVKAGKAVSAEWKKWQAKGKALPVEKVTITTQTDYIQEPTAVHNGTQTEVVLEELEKAMKRKRERKGKERAKNSEDTVMKDGSNKSDTDREMYKELSGYEDENEALVAAPPATKIQAAPCSAARLAGKRSRPAKTPPRSASSDDNGLLVKAMVIHRVPCQRPMGDTIQDVGVKGIMGARWLLEGMRRFGKATSSVVVFFDRKLALGSHLKVRGRWLPIEAYDFDRGRRRVERSDW